MNALKWLGFLLLGILLVEDHFVESRHHHHHHHSIFHKRHHHHHHHHKKKGGFFKRIFKKIKHGISNIGRKLLDKPPKNRSRFDKYPIYVMRYHQFIWHRFFKRYIDHVDDDRPKLPKVRCWSIKCWMRRNKFKRYWKRRTNITVSGKNSPPFLHRRCRIPGTHGKMCVREHLRHDYYWRMFMWIGRYGFPKNPQRKRICITDMCRFKKKLYKRYWKNFWMYTSLVPAIRPYDFHWKFWFWRFGGNVMRLQQVVGPALMAMGMGGTMIMGGNAGVMMLHGMRNFMTIEMKQALMAVMQKNLMETMHLASTSQYSLQRQKMALAMIMRIPAFPAATTAHLQMQNMMQNMRYQQQMQQMQMQNMLRQQMWGMARYLRGSCGCKMCSGSGMYHGGMPSGSSMYMRHNGMISSVNPGMMSRHSGMMGMGGMGMGMGGMPIPLTPVRNLMELNMRVKALYAKNNLPMH